MVRQDGGPRDRPGRGDNRGQPGRGGGMGGNKGRGQRRAAAPVPAALPPKSAAAASTEGNGMVALGKQNRNGAQDPNDPRQAEGAKQQSGPSKAPAWGGVKAGSAVDTPAAPEAAPWASKQPGSAAGGHTNQAWTGPGREAAPQVPPAANGRIEQVAADAQPSGQAASSANPQQSNQTGPPAIEEPLGRGNHPPGGPGGDRSEREDNFQAGSPHSQHHWRGDNLSAGYQAGSTQGQLGRRGDDSSAGFQTGSPHSQNRRKPRGGQKPRSHNAGFQQGSQQALSHQQQSWRRNEPLPPRDQRTLQLPQDARASSAPQDPRDSLASQDARAKLPPQNARMPALQPVQGRQAGAAGAEPPAAAASTPPPPQTQPPPRPQPSAQPSAQPPAHQSELPPLPPVRSVWGRPSSAGPPPPPPSVSAWANLSPQVMQAEEGSNRRQKRTSGQVTVTRHPQAAPHQQPPPYQQPPAGALAALQLGEPQQESLPSLQDNLPKDDVPEPSRRLTEEPAAAAHGPPEPIAAAVAEPKRAQQPDSTQPQEVAQRSRPRPQAGLAERGQPQSPQQPNAFAQFQRPPDSAPAKAPEAEPAQRQWGRQEKLPDASSGAQQPLTADSSTTTPAGSWQSPGFHPPSPMLPPQPTSAPPRRVPSATHESSGELPGRPSQALREPPHVQREPPQGQRQPPQAQGQPPQRQRQPPHGQRQPPQSQRQQLPEAAAPRQEPLQPPAAELPAPSKGAWGASGKSFAQALADGEKQRQQQQQQQQLRVRTSKGSAGAATQEQSASTPGSSQTQQTSPLSQPPQAAGTPAESGTPRSEGEAAAVAMVLEAEASAREAEASARKAASAEANLSGANGEEAQPVAREPSSSAGAPCAHHILATPFPAERLDKEATEGLRSLVQEYPGVILGSRLRLEPRGLINTGNLCFMNSVLQALMASSPFCSLLKALQTAAAALSPQATPVLHGFARLATAFPPAPEPAPKEDKAVAKANSIPCGQPLLPEAMFEAVNAFNPRNVQLNPLVGDLTPAMAERAQGKRRNREQEDAQEFLGYLLDSAHEELVRVRTAYEGSLQLGAAEANGGFEDSGDWVKQKKRNKKAIAQETGMKGLATAIQDLCGGRFVTQLKAVGAPQRDTTQPFSLLTLDIVPADVVSLADAINRFVHPTTLEDYRLQKDAPPVRATLRVLFHELPRLLIVHLGRFTFDLGSGNSKVHKPVRFEARLQMRAAWLAAESPQRRNPPAYNLVATVTHLGVNAASGHYVAKVKQPGGGWLAFDDANVTACPLARVLEEPAYLLIYELAQ